MVQTAAVGALIREWRQRRRLSQLDLACDAEISARHLSFIETGRSQPSREMILKLAEQLQVPLRETNALLTAGGYAQAYRETGLEDPALGPVMQAVQLVLNGHEPYPALALDRHWTMVAANRAVAGLLTGVDPKLLTPPVNVLRLALHPKGLAPRTLNLPEWRTHLLMRLQQQIDLTADQSLIDLRKELLSYAPSAEKAYAAPSLGIAAPFRLSTPLGELELMSATTIFGTPLDVTLSELAIESFFPADQNSADLLGRLFRPESSG